MDRVGRVLAANRELMALLAADRSNPLLSLGLTMQQLKVLLVLSSMDGGISVHALADELRVSMATVTGLVDRVVATGHVVRTADAADRRVRRLSLTAAGQQVCDDVLNSGAAQLERLFRRLDDETLDMFDTVLRRLLAAARTDP